MVARVAHKTAHWFNALKLVGWFILLAYFPIAMFFVSHAKSELRCQIVKTDVHSDEGNVLITSKGLLSIIKNRHPEFVGSLLSDVDYAALEEEVEALPMVRRCEAYPTIGGAVHVDIYQRRPIMRVFAGGLILHGRGGLQGDCHFCHALAYACRQWARELYALAC